MVGPNERRPQWVGMLVLPFLVMAVLALGWGFQGLYNQDAHAYLRLAAELKGYWTGGRAPVSYWPLGYPALGGLVGLLVGDGRWGLLFVSAVAWTALALGFRRILVDAGADRDRAWWYTLLTVGSSPFLLRHGVVVMSDVPAIALAVWALCLGLRSGQRNTLPAVVLATAAVLVRMPMAVLLAPLLVVSIARNWRAGSLAERAVLLATLAVCGALVAVATVAALDHPLGLQMRPEHLWMRTFRTVDGEHSFLLPNGLFVLKPLVHPGFLLIAPACWAFFRRADLRAPHVPVVLACLASYLLFLGMFPDQNDRLLLPAVPLVALLLAAAFLRLASLPVVRTWRTVIVAAALLLQLLLFARVIAPFVQQDRNQRELAQWIHAEGASTVYTFGVDQALGTYGYSGKVVDLWRSEVDRFEPGGLVLFNPVGNAAQWKDRAPMRNWQRAVQQGADTVGVRPDGWVLLRIR